MFENYAGPYLNYLNLNFTNFTTSR